MLNREKKQECLPRGVDKSGQHNESHKPVNYFNEFWWYPVVEMYNTLCAINSLEAYKSFLVREKLKAKKVCRGIDIRTKMVYKKRNFLCFLLLLSWKYPKYVRVLIGTKINFVYGWLTNILTYKEIRFAWFFESCDILYIGYQNG